MQVWTINKLVVLILIGTLAVLLLEIRFEHQAVLGEHLIAWMPIVYSGVMAILGFAALFFWERGVRRILFWAFAIALIVGTVGFWQHNEEHFGQRIAGVFTVWEKPAPEHHHSDENKSDEPSSENQDGDHQANQNDGQQTDNHKKEESLLPPIFAPLTFAGLGVLGMLACARRFQPRP